MEKYEQHQSDFYTGFGEHQSACDPVSHPEHYTSRGIECIEIAETFNYNLGNVIKYVWRSGLKQDAVQDLRKAVWYLEREIARLTDAGA